MDELEKLLNTDPKNDEQLMANEPSPEQVGI